MKVLLLIAALALLSGCQPPVSVDDVIWVKPQVPAEQPAPAPPAEDPPAVTPPPETPPPETPAPDPVPVWEPVLLHIYVLDATDTILVDEKEDDAAQYRQRWTAWSLTVELWNRDNPHDLQHVVGGGVGP